jgi:hypothetical protein
LPPSDLAAERAPLANFRRRIIIGMSDGSLISFLADGFKFEVSVTHKLQTAPISALLALSQSPSDSFYAGTLDGDVILCKEEADGKFRAEQQRNIMGNPVSGITACPAGIAVALMNGQISLLHALTLHPLLDVAAHARSIYAMTSLDGGRKLVTAGLDTAIHVWTFTESHGTPVEMFLSQTLHLPNWYAAACAFYAVAAMNFRCALCNLHFTLLLAVYSQALPQSRRATSSPAPLIPNISKFGAK